MSKKVKKKTVKKGIKRPTAGRLPDVKEYLNETFIAGVILSDFRFREALSVISFKRASALFNGRLPAYWKMSSNLR